MLCSTNIPHLGQSENIFLLFIQKKTKIYKIFWLTKSNIETHLTEIQHKMPDSSNFTFLSTI